MNAAKGYIYALWTKNQDMSGFYLWSVSVIFGWSICINVNVCTFACVPGGVKTFSNMPSLSLHHQNGKGHLTHGAMVSRGWSSTSIVCLHCVISRRWLWGWIMRVRVNISTTWLDWDRSVSSLGCFSDGTSSHSHSRWFVPFPFLLKRFILPNVIFTVVLLWHLKLKDA